MTRNITRRCRPAYMYVSNKTGEEADGNAPSIGVFDTHNGGPIVQFPSAMVVMRV